MTKTASEASVDVDKLLDKLKSLYAKHGKEAEYEREEQLSRELVTKLGEQLTRAFELVKPFGLGSTATVWEVRDSLLEQSRALKLPRPREGKLDDIIETVRKEIASLARLTHQNVIKIVSAGEIDLDLHAGKSSVPYFIMDYLKGAKDLDEFILEHRKALRAEDVIGHFRDVLNGLTFLHGRGVIHCDLKPGNLFVADGTPALIADLGYARHLPESEDEAEQEVRVTYTPGYAHPGLAGKAVRTTDSNANVAKLPRRDLKPAFDLYSVGRTMQMVLAAVRDAEAKETESRYSVDRESILSRYQWHYLGTIAKRLLDGQEVKPPSDDEFGSDVCPGLTPKMMQEICYKNAAEALEDIEKLLGLYDLEGTIPELNPNISTYVQIPECKAPLTPRVARVIEHSALRRLAGITQLGFVSLVYPGANHSRLEHLLGTFARSCAYVRALWYDKRNCMFQSIMSHRDLELGLVTALVHDVAQYAMAHDLTEVDSEFSHEGFTASVLHHAYVGEGSTLAGVIEREWGILADEIEAVLRADHTSPFRYRLLSSLIDGPLDCDKLDYLRRDSLHLGVGFANAIDEERLVRNLTIVYGEEFRDDDAKRHIAEVSVYEKALAVANTLWRVREDMYRQAYWQHTVRSFKAMLSFAVRRCLLQLNQDAKAVFWGEFTRLSLFGESVDMARPVNSPKGVEGSSHDSPEFLASVSEESAGGVGAVGRLTGGDDAMLMFLAKWSDEIGREVIKGIRERRPYRRLGILSSRPDGAYRQIYDRVRTYRLDAQAAHIEGLRKKWEDAVLVRVQEKVGGTAADGVAERLESLKEVSPLVLVDVPIKGTSRKPSDEALRFVPEDYSGVHERAVKPRPRFRKSEARIKQEEFDLAIGKIRMFVHPDWSDFLSRWINDEEAEGIICK